MQNQNRFYEFANFRIDVAKNRLLKDGEPLAVTPKAIEILLFLAQNSGRVVEKDELMAAIWPDTVVEESNLTQTIYVLRKVLGQDASGDGFIQTVPKRGYRFVHELRAVADERDRAVQQRTTSLALIGQPELKGVAPALTPQASPDRLIKSRSRLALQFILPVSAGVLVTALFFFYWNHKGSSDQNRRAIHAIAVLPFQSIGMGRFDEAIAETKHAEQLDPVSLQARTLVGWAYYHARRFDEAIKIHQATLDMDSGFEWGHQSLGWAYVQKGRYKEAIEELKRALELQDSSFNLAGLGYAYAMAGNRSEAQKSFEDLVDRSKREHVPLYLIAILYGALGQKHEALSCLEEAYKTRAGQLIYLKIDPRLDVLRSEPGFKNLLQRMNF